MKTNGVPLKPATAAVLATSTMYSSEGVSENEKELAILFATRDPVCPIFVNNFVRFSLSSVFCLIQLQRQVDTALSYTVHIHCTTVQQGLTEVCLLVLLIIKDIYKLS